MLQKLNYQHMKLPDNMPRISSTRFPFSFYFHLNISNQLVNLFINTTYTVARGMAATFFDWFIILLNQYLYLYLSAQDKKRILTLKNLTWSCRYEEVRISEGLD